MRLDAPPVPRRTFLTPKRIRVWGTGLFVVSWFVYFYTMTTPGITDRVGRVKGADYVQFYVMGSLVLEGRSDALYDPQAHISEGRRRIQPDLQLYAGHPNYGPQVALAFAPLALLPYGQSLTLFLVLSTLCYAASIWIISRHCPSVRAHTSIIVVLAGASPLFFALLRYGQTSAIALLIWALALSALQSGRLFLAGIVVGFLAYKPQLGIIIGVVILATRQWRLLAGAVASVIGQLFVDWLVAGSLGMSQYFRTLWTLALQPRLIEIYPTEVHSIRGFIQLLLPSDTLVALCVAASLIAITVAAINNWSTQAPVRLRVAQVILLTILATPHLLTYDLVLLTLPLLIIVDWLISHPHFRLRSWLAAGVALAYFAPFSSNLARVVPVQTSVPVIAAVAWMLSRIIAGSDNEFESTATGRSVEWTVPADDPASSTA